MACTCPGFLSLHMHASYQHLQQFFAHTPPLPTSDATPPPVPLKLPNYKPNTWCRPYCCINKVSYSPTKTKTNTDAPLSATISRELPPDIFWISSFQKNRTHYETAVCGILTQNMYVDRWSNSSTAKNVQIIAPQNYFWLYGTEF